MEAFLKARGKENQPSTTGWQFKNWSTDKYEDDGSLTCNNFIASAPCYLTLSLNGGAKEVQGKCEGVYKRTGLVSMGREVREIYQQSFPTAGHGRCSNWRALLVAISL